MPRFTNFFSAPLLAHSPILPPVLCDGHTERSELGQPHGPPTCVQTEAGAQHRLRETCRDEVCAGKVSLAWSEKGPAHAAPGKHSQERLGELLGGAGALSRRGRAFWRRRALKSASSVCIRGSPSPCHAAEAVGCPRSKTAIHVCTSPRTAAGFPPGTSGQHGGQGEGLRAARPSRVLQASLKHSQAPYLGKTGRGSQVSGPRYARQTLGGRAGGAESSRLVADRRGDVASAGRCLCP